MRAILGIAYTALALLTYSGAFAADLPYKAASPYAAAAPVAPSPNWTGFYVGLNGGGGWAVSDQDIAGLASVPTTGAGGLLGGQVGYNWQFNNRWVIGIETDLDWANIGGSGVADIGATSAQTLQWVGTVRGRGGYLVTPSTLVYGTGGFAYGSVKSTTADISSGNSVSSTSTQYGWTLGGGLEQAIFNTWSVKVEYDYISLGSVNTILENTAISQPGHYQTIKLGVNYRF